MAVALLFVVLIAIAAWAVARSTRKLKTALIGIGVMLVTELIGFTAFLLSFPHTHWSSHTLALNGSISAVFVTPIALIAGFVAVLIASGKFRKPLTNEVSH